jgi:hypothetical protein
MNKHISKYGLSAAFLGVIAFGALNNVACDDDNNDNIPVTTGTAGHGGSHAGGSGGHAGSSAGGSGGSSANVTVYAVQLTGANEVPMNASTATGSVTVSLNPATGAVMVSGSYSGLTAAATKAHIHGPADPGMSADIIVTLTQSGGTSGTVSGGGTLNPSQITDMQNGKTYVNVHTSTYPDGEIRGQITP